MFSAFQKPRGPIGIPSPPAFQCPRSGFHVFQCSRSPALHPPGVQAISFPSIGRGCPPDARIHAFPVREEGGEETRRPGSAPRSAVSAEVEVGVEGDEGEAEEGGGAEPLPVDADDVGDAQAGHAGAEKAHAEEHQDA